MGFGDGGMWGVFCGDMVGDDCGIVGGIGGVVWCLEFWGGFGMMGV